jgi:hypothetical protein
MLVINQKNNGNQSEVRPMKKSTGSAVLLAASALALGTSNVNAIEQWQNGIDIRAGYMGAKNDTTIALTGERNSGEIDLEDVFDLDEDVDSVRAAIAWRFKDRHELSVDIYSLQRDGSNTARGDFDFTSSGGDFVEVEAGAKFKTEINFDIYDITYGYSFIITDRHHLAVSAGLYWMDMDVALDGEASGKVKVNGEVLEPGDTDVSSRSDISAPMPLIGALYEYAVTPSWTVGTHVRYFDITVDPYSGSILNVDLSTTYSFDTFYFGAGYSWVNINVKIDDDSWNGSLDWEFEGPRLFVGARF